MGTTKWMELLKGKVMKEQLKSQEGQGPVLHMIDVHMMSITWLYIFKIYAMSMLGIQILECHYTGNIENPEPEWDRQVQECSC